MCSNVEESKYRHTIVVSDSVCVVSEPVLAHDVTVCIPRRLWSYSLVMLLHIAGLGAIRFRTGGMCRGPLGPIMNKIRFSEH